MKATQDDTAGHAGESSTDRTKGPKVLRVCVAIDTTAFETSHGRKPRGRGCWAFCPANKWNGQDYLEHVIWITPACTYTEAARQAKATAAQRGITSLVACS